MCSGIRMVHAVCLVSVSCAQLGLIGNANGQQYQQQGYDGQYQQQPQQYQQPGQPQYQQQQYQGPSGGLPPNSGAPNPFRATYAQKEQSFSPTVYRDAGGGNLKKQTIQQKDMKKAVVIFYGDWCPHCDTLLASFAQYMGLLRQHGINVIFVHVPQGDKLGKQPTADDYNQAVQKVTVHGIALDGSTAYVAIVADQATLAKTGITGLPVLLILKNGKEQFRGIGQDAIQQMNLGDPVTQGQFLEIFKAADESDDSDKKGDGQKGKGKGGAKGKGKGSEGTGDSSGSFKKPKIPEANFWTEMFNKINAEGLCAVAAPPPTSKPGTQTPAPPAPQKKAHRVHNHKKGKENCPVCRLPK
ncbi:MAG: thioredoxin family protein [Holosporales bacterium]|nr:thioredoxin family protein [Holosporales bacterium]